MKMSTKSEEKRLLNALNEQEALTLKNFRFELVDKIGIVVRRSNQTEGFWRYQSGRFAWTPSGYYEATVHTKGIDDAVTFTLSLLDNQA